jgi:hypothetical protein
VVQPVVDEFVDDRRVGEGRGVAEETGLVRRDLAQDAPHDLARAGLLQSGRPLQEVGGGDRADLPPHPGDEFAAQFVARRLVDPQGHEGVDALAFDVVRIADDRGLGDPRMGDERALDLGGAEAVR